jgi:molecular chaperone Hsp33
VTEPDSGVRSYTWDNALRYTASISPVPLMAIARPRRGRLRMLGEADIRSILTEKGRVDVDGEYCANHYEFDAVDVEQLFAAGLITDTGLTRH